MRRKCFYFFIAVMIILYFLDYAGIPLSASIDSRFFESSCDFTGKVVGIREKEDMVRLEVNIESADGRKTKMRDNILLNYYGNNINTWELLNCRISFNTRLNYPQTQRNPHCFNYEKYLRSRGIGAVAQVNSIRKCDGTLTVKERYERQLLKQKKLFCSRLSAETKGIVMGVLFGDTSYLDEEIYEEFKKNGTAHILAVSGLHIGIIYGIYKKLTRKGKSIKALILLALVMYTYGELSCWSPSVTRAVLMMSMSVLARLYDLRYDMLTSMSAVGLLLICANPYVIFGAGFQLSFLAISSIAFFKPLIPTKIPETAATSLAVYIGLLLYQIYNFNYISFTALIANVPVVFLAGYFVPLAAAGFITFAFTGRAGVLGVATDAMGKVIYYVNSLTSLDGKGGIDVISPPLWFALIVGASMFFISSEAFEIMRLRRNRKNISFFMGGIAAIALIFQIITYCPVTYDDIVFVDVGQGDCVHIRDGRNNILIDGGGSLNYNVGKKTLKQYLLKNGTGRIDLAIATHEHMDHIKGLEELSQCFKINKIMTRVTAGTEIKAGAGVRVETLWPEFIPEDKGQEENSMCSVFMIYCKGSKILVTGDIDQEGERKIIEKYKGTDKLKADVLKIGHHGSNTSTSEEFLDAVNPSYAVIQTGKNNFGHPAPKTIEKCIKKGIMVLRNDYNGAIGFSFDKGKVKSHVMIKN